MDSMDNFRERFEALEQQTEQLKHQTQTLARQVRWWRGIACGVMLLGLVSLPLQSGTAADTQGGIPERLAAVEHKLSAMTFDAAVNEVVITGANLRIVNGLGSTFTTNGVGNLIVGYNELVNDRRRPDVRTGSHNVVVGSFNNFSSFGGLVVGETNEISGQFASVSGGFRNSASGANASVSGGFLNTASSDVSSVSGGQANQATGIVSSVSGGFLNTASGYGSSVSGGDERKAPAQYNWAAGGLFQAN